MKNKQTTVKFVNSKLKLNTSNISNNDLINQIKKYKDELLIDLQEMVYTSEQPIPDSFFNLSRLINKL